jgi:hypothetical protein
MFLKLRNTPALTCLLFTLLSHFFGHHAQAQSASVSGRVSDPSSAIVSEAQVTLIDVAKKTSQTTKTNDAGIYSFAFVQPGVYTLSVESAGFKRFERTRIIVETAQSLVSNIRLQVGDTSESVTVNGSDNGINTTDASVSTVIDRHFVENMPLNGRSFQSLMAAVPGVAVVSSQGAGRSGELTVNGQRTEANYFTVDGVSVTTGTAPYSPGFSAGYGGSLAGETVLGTTQSLISIDGLQEFRATTSTYSAEYGRTPGGQFTFSTRSGTNDWHGSAFEYLRNDALDANNWFNNYYGQARQAERQNDFGGTFSGPVRIPAIYNGQDKTFFFFSYEGLRLQQPQAAQQYEVPGLDLRTSAPAPLQPYLNAFPLPNGSDSGDGLAYFTAGYVSPSALDTTSVRIDHNFTDAFKVFGRFSNSSSNTTGRTSGSLSNPGYQDGKIKTLTLGSTNVLSSRLSNEARFNVTWNDSRQTYSIDTLGGAKPIALTDIPGLTNSDWFFFCINYSTYPCYRLTPQTNNQRQWNITDTMNTTIGRHSLKWGVDFRRLTTDGSLPGNYVLPGFYGESSILANQPEFLVNYHSQGRMTPVYLNLSLFAQDEWKVRPRLNLSLGLRWELNPAPHDAKGNNPYTVTTTDLATAAAAPKGASLWSTTYNNFAPRVGAAYKLHEAAGNQTVLRAGGGIFYDTGNTQGSSGYFFGLGVTSRTDFSGSSLPLTSGQIGSSPAPSAAAPYNSELIGFDPHLKFPYTLQWNVALEQELGSKQSLTLSYVASSGKRLLLQKQYDPTLSGNPNFVSSAGGGLGLYLTTNSASSNYNSLQIQFQRHLAAGLQALLSYTWAHAIDDASSNFQIYTQQRGPSDNDIRNNFQAAVTYDLPSKYGNRIAAYALGNWALDTRISARSALPVDITGTYAVDATGASVSFHPDFDPSRPLYALDPSAPGGRRINFDAFSVAANADGNNIEGNFARNAARGFDAVQADVAIRRNFPFTERTGLQLRVEAFNILNHPVFGTIHNSLGDGAELFGMAYQTQNSSLGGLSSLYQTGGPRSLQASLKLHF